MRALAKSAGAELITGQAVVGTEGGKALTSVIHPFNAETGEVSGDGPDHPVHDPRRLRRLVTNYPAGKPGGRQAGLERATASLPAACSPNPAASGFRNAVWAHAAGGEGSARLQRLVLEIASNAIQNKRHLSIFRHDVTADDLRQAAQEGFAASEHVKRYTTLGMATDQGRNVEPAGTCDPGQGAGHFHSRGRTDHASARPPPASPFGAIAAERFGDLRPYRLHADA